jgi:predicted PurR-regulated permease PerM
MQTTSFSLLNYPVLIATILALVASIAVLALKGKSLSFPAKIACVAVLVVAVAILAFFVWAIIAAGTQG